jgi:hypothetical protein
MIKPGGRLWSVHQRILEAGEQAPQVRLGTDTDPLGEQLPGVFGAAFLTLLCRLGGRGT